MCPSLDRRGFHNLLFCLTVLVMILSAFDAQLEWHLRHLEESHYSTAWWRGGKNKTHNQEGIRFHGRGVEGVDLHLCVSNQAQVSRAEHGGKHHCCLPTILGWWFLTSRHPPSPRSSSDGRCCLLQVSHGPPICLCTLAFLSEAAGTCEATGTKQKNSLLALTTCSSLQLGCPQFTGLPPPSYPNSSPASSCLCLSCFESPLITWNLSLTQCFLINTFVYQCTYDHTIGI